jgi:hypothetical protein
MSAEVFFVGSEFLNCLFFVFCFYFCMVFWTPFDVRFRCVSMLTGVRSSAIPCC